MILRKVSIKDYKKIKNLFKKNNLDILNNNRWKNQWKKNPIMWAIKKILTKDLKSNILKFNIK